MFRLNSSLRFLFFAALFAVFALNTVFEVSAQKKARKTIGSHAVTAGKKTATKNANSTLNKSLRKQNQDVPWTGEAGVARTTAQLQSEFARAPKNREIKPKFGERDHVPPDRKNLPQNPESPAIAKFPFDPTTEPVRQSVSPDSPATSAQTVPLNFNGATLFDTLSFPPDTMGDAGPSQYIVAVNGWIRSFNKNTGAVDGVLNMSIDTFFNSVRDNATTTDPRIRYDRLSQRWFVVIINDPPSGTNNRVLIAVSNSPTITAGTTWIFYQFQINAVAPEGDAGCFADYPTLGIDVNALYIGVNNFCPNSFAGSSAYVVRKSSVLNGGPIVATAFRGLVPTGQSDGPYTPQGVDNFDPAATEGYFIGVSNAVFGRLVLRRVSDPGGNPTISSNINISVPSTFYASSVPHLGNTGGNSGNLDTLDDRLFQAHLRNGRLYTAHNVAVNASGISNTTGDRVGSRWYEIDNLSAAPSLRQSGTWFDNAASPKNFWIPSIMISGQGHIAMGGTSAGVTDSINAAVIGRLASDALGTLQTPVIYTNSSATYNPPSNPGGPGGRRWGDYSYTSIDPEDDMTMWTIQQWNHASNSYAVRVAKLLAPPPAAPTGAEPSNLSGGQSSVNIVINGTSTNGSGFFDPGANFPKRLQVTISGGVTVNSVTYNNPTQITVNVSTASAPNGSKNVTVTNPDGQTVTANNLINVSGTQIATIKPQVDFDADGKTDISVFRNSGGSGFWYYLRSTDNAAQSLQWGNGTDLPTPADFDGDNKTDVAVFRPSNSTWYILNTSNNTFVAAQWGTSGDKPAPGDFDGDNRADISVFRPAAGTWFVLRSSDGGFTAQNWGTNGDIPVFGRYDADNKDDFAVFRPSNSTWYVQQSSDGGIRSQQWGTGGDVPVAGDYDNDGRFDFAVFRPSNGGWYAANSSNGGTTSGQWGQNGDIPTPGDYDGDRKHDFAVFRPSDGTWYILRSSNGSIYGTNFGLANDKPLPSAYSN